MVYDILTIFISKLEITAMKVYIFLIPVLSLLVSCGYKGDLYLPKDNDDGKFGPIQTGIGIKPNNTPEPKQSKIPKQSDSNSEKPNP